jgi:hypothetical protein
MNGLEDPQPNAALGGRPVSGAETITVTKNEILYSLNKPDDYVLAIVEFSEDNSHRVHYVADCQNARCTRGFTHSKYALRPCYRDQEYETNYRILIYQAVQGVSPT